MFDETPKIDFTVKDDSGLVIFRDALIFSSMSELRNTSSDERQAIMQKDTMITKHLLITRTL